MKRLLTTSRILACLIFLTIWESKTYAQGSISSYPAGTETFKITSNTRINSQSTEYQYYASANISLFIGAKEVWKEPKLIGDSYYLSSKGNPGIKPNDNAGTGKRPKGNMRTPNASPKPTNNSRHVAQQENGIKKFFKRIFGLKK